MAQCQKEIQDLSEPISESPAAIISALYFSREAMLRFAMFSSPRYYVRN